jgi:hypothetical protein
MKPSAYFFATMSFRKKLKYFALMPSAIGRSKLGPSFLTAGRGQVDGGAAPVRL